MPDAEPAASSARPEREARNPAAGPCPKCGAQDLRGDACPTCGLAVTRRAAYTRTRDAAVPGPVHQAWAQVAEHWSDGARHDELLRLVVASDCYAWAAGRYRTREADSTAQRQLERLRRSAEAALLGSRMVRGGGRRLLVQVVRAAAFGLIAVVAIGIVYLVAINLAAAPIVGDQGPAGSRVEPLRPGHPVGSSTITTTR